MPLEPNNQVLDRTFNSARDPWEVLVLREGTADGSTEAAPATAAGENVRVTFQQIDGVDAESLEDIKVEQEDDS